MVISQQALTMWTGQLEAMSPLESNDSIRAGSMQSSGPSSGGPEKGWQVAVNKTAALLVRPDFTL